jgi:ATP-binding cassette subfamily B protein
MEKEPKKIPKGIYRRIFQYIGHYSLFILLSMALAAVVVAFTLYAPILIGDAIDSITGPGQVDFASITPLLVKTGILIGATAVLQWLMNTINNRITYHIVRDVRNSAIRKLEILPLSYLDSHSTGDTVNRMISDADQFADGLLMGFTQLFTGVLTILGTLGFLFSIHLLIALVVVLVTPLSLFIARFIAAKTYEMFRIQSETRGEQTAFIDEMIGNQKVVQAFSHEDEALETFDEINERLAKASLKATFFSSITNPSTRFINSIVYAGVALTGALLSIRTAGSAAPFTVGALACCLSYATQYTKPFNEISGVVTELQNALACASRLLDFIDEEPQTAESASALVLSHPEGNVELEQVSFSYVPHKPLIQDLSLSVKPGQRIAIVGPTGCGKTTLINLLMRFYDVNEGAIRIDGTDVRDSTRESLRKSFGMVLQDTWLRTATIRENLRMGKPDATEEEILAAAKASHAHSFIRRLPEGYDTVINEEGDNLSIGQKQLLCITRVMLCLPPMLILDEATSSIDTRTEIQIQEAFARLMKGRTSFIVAHRLSTIQNADVILVMKDGHLLEQGSHETLLAKKGFYADLYNSQFEP